jgi:hypothetical protein
MMEDAAGLDEDDERAALLSNPKRLSVIQTLAMWQDPRFLMKLHPAMLGQRPTPRGAQDRIGLLDILPSIQYLLYFSLKLPVILYPNRI